MKLGFITFLLFPILSIISGCTNKNNNPVLYSPDRQVPVVTGLFFTFEVSPEVYAVWGNPSGSSFCQPSIGSYTNILFALPEQLNIKVWVVPARLPQQSSEEVINLLNGHFNKINGLAVNVLLDTVLQAGYHSVEYRFKDSKEKLLPEGFYRIYVLVGNWLKFGDVLNFRDESNYYKALVNQIYKQRVSIGRLP